MEVKPQLARQMGIDDYLTASSGADVLGFIYIDTARTLGTGKEMTDWAAQQFEEIKYLRRIAEGNPIEGEGHTEEHAKLLRGFVPWAPINRGVAVFEEYLAEAERVAGPLAWGKIKGFRYLLQQITNRDEFTDLALNDETVEVLRLFKAKGRNFVFDVGVDQRSGGIWQLEAAAAMIQRVHDGVNENDKVTFVLSKCHVI